MPIYTLVILCAAALVLWVYHYDSYEKEPWWAVIVSVLTGFGVMWLLGQADNFAIRTFELTNQRVLAKAAVISLIEEGGKLFTVLLLANLLLRRHFNDPMDGLIYGRLAGVGMAVQESMLYLSIHPATLSTFGMEIVRLFAHSLMGGIVGFAIGLGARPDGSRQTHARLATLCVALSTTMHFGWNTVAYAPRETLGSRIMPMGIMLLMMVLWRWFCHIAQTRSRQLFTSTAPVPA
jgi:RsiW-degrading membrane proteinase PrsW (M82 family)